MGKESKVKTSNSEQRWKAWQKLKLCETEVRDGMRKLKMPKPQGGNPRDASEGEVKF